jgi:hypothetical protein
MMMMGVVGDTRYHHTETLPMRLSDFVVQDIQLGFFVYYFFCSPVELTRVQGFVEPGILLCTTFNAASLPFATWLVLETHRRGSTPAAENNHPFLAQLYKGIHMNQVRCTNLSHLYVGAGWKQS